MLPTKAVRLQLGELLAADATTLAPAADANIVTLLMADFVYDESTELADLVPATFTGATPKAAGVGTQQTGVDPATGDQLVTLLAPAGGWRWEATALTNLPQTIYGAMLTNDDATVLLALHKPSAPVIIQSVGDQVQLGALTMTIVQQPIS